MTNAAVQILASFKIQSQLANGAWPVVAPPAVLKQFQALAGTLYPTIPISYFSFDERTLAASASEELILNNNSMLDEFGVGITYATLKFAFIGLKPGQLASGIQIGNAGTNPIALWSGGVTQTDKAMIDGPPFLKGGGVGITVDSTHCRIKIANLDAVNPAIYQIMTAGV